MTPRLTGESHANFFSTHFGSQMTPLYSAESLRTFLKVRMIKKYERQNAQFLSDVIIR